MKKLYLLLPVVLLFTIFLNFNTVSAETVYTGQYGYMTFYNSLDDFGFTEQQKSVANSYLASYDNVVIAKSNIYNVGYMYIYYFIEPVPMPLKFRYQSFSDYGTLYERLYLNDSTTTFSFHRLLVKQDGTIYQDNITNLKGTSFADCGSSFGNKYYYYSTIDVYNYPSATNLLVPKNNNQVLKKYLYISGNYDSDFTRYEFIVGLQNADGTETIQYQLNNNVWRTYSDIVTITDNQLIRARALDVNGNVIDYLEINITDITKSDNSSNNFNIIHYMKDYKSYIIPVTIGNFPYTIGVRVKAINGLENIVEPGYDVFNEKNVNEQFIITGRKSTNYTLLFEFYNKTTGTVLKQSTLTVTVPADR